jgi:hypothetical protein
MGRNGTPLDPRLKDVATGKAFNNSAAALQYRQLSGQVYRGLSPDLSPELVDLTGDRAQVKDCSFDHTEIYNTRTNAVDHAADTGRFLHTGTLIVEAGRWKVATIENGGGCRQ